MSGMPKDDVDLRVLLVGMGHYPGLSDKDLDGGVGDVLTWHELLVDVGVPDASVWVAATVPTGDLPKEDRFDHRRRDRRACQSLLKNRGKRAESTGTAAAVSALIERFVAKLPKGGSKRCHALVVWSGHGWTSPDGELHLVTADSALVGGSPLGGGGSLAGTLPVDTLMDILDRRPADARLTLVLDTCFAGGLEHRNLNSRDVGWVATPPRREGAVVLMASQGAQRAREVHMRGRTMGAFTWALTSVLSRWNVEQSDTIDISPENLVARAGALLFSLGIAQLPAFDGPPEAMQEPLLTRMGTGACAPVLPGIEVDPDFGGRVYDVTYGTTLMARKMVATTPTTSFGVTPSKRLWLYEPYVGETFNIKPSTDQSAPTSSANGCFQDEGWSPTPVTSLPTNPTGKGWKITKTSGGAVVGWMYLDSSEGLVFVCKGTNRSLFPTEITFTWQTTLQIDTQSSYYIAQCPKVTS